VSPLTIDTPVEQPPRTRPPGDRLPPRPPVDDGDGDGSPGQPPRPATTTPLRNFYLAGDWIDTGLPGTIESAVLSGHRAARAIIESA